MTTVAALFVEKGGVYYGLPDVDPWDEERDARLYAGPHPVVAHPPCQLWINYAALNFKRYGGEHNRMKKRPLIRREHGRIWFGEGRERWSVTDPEAPEHQFTRRDLNCDWFYMISTCPDTKSALGKVRLIRWALRNVERIESAPRRSP